MKRISLIALSVTAAMAQLPAAKPVAAPAPAPAAPPPAPVSYSYSAPAAAEAPAATATSSAPLAPIHDDLIYRNPALPASIGWLMTAPGDFFGKREAAFQWDGSTASSFNGSGLAVLDQAFVGFSSNGIQGELAGGYILPSFGAGLRMNLRKTGFSSDTANLTEQDSTFSPTSFGAFGSAGINNLTVFGHLDWGTPQNYGSRTVKQTVIVVGPPPSTNTIKTTTASRSDALSLGAGVTTPAKGDQGLSWAADLELMYQDNRPSGTSSDSTSPRYDLGVFGAIGKTFTVDNFILAAGLNGSIEYWNEKGAVPAGLNLAHAFRGNVDYGYAVSVDPNISVILPIFEHWKLTGGATAGLMYQREDVFPGDKTVIFDELTTTGPGGNLGIRYERGRWAAEAQVVNGFLSKGPNFISGQAGNLFTSFAVTANFK